MSSQNDEPTARGGEFRFSPSMVAVLLLSAVAATLGILLWDSQRKLRVAESRAESPSAPKLKERLEKATKLEEQERKYLNALATRYGMRRPPVWCASDVLKLVVRMNQDLNKLIPSTYDPKRTPWLLPSPKTLASRNLDAAKMAPFDLASGVIQATEPISLYQYTLSNSSDIPVPMPILHQGVRWDSLADLIESQGFSRVSDELERAILIWRFISQHRMHGTPVTEGSEEHDVIKLLSCYGFGFCDDAARALAVVATQCGLQARIRSLEGHVVPEVLANGKWRMLDPDFAVYFHEPGNPREILGVAELEQGPERFANARALGSGGPWSEGYAAPFLSKEDNSDWPSVPVTHHVLHYTLQPGESITFSNFNWGSYFLGAYPDKPARFYNGFIARDIVPGQVRVEDRVVVQVNGQGFNVINKTVQASGFVVDVECPFPVVGGEISGIPADVLVEFIDRERISPLRMGRTASLAPVVAQLRETPTYTFSLRFSVPPGKTVKFEKAPRVLADFQFAELPLLKLRQGENKFQAYGVRGELTAQLRFR